MKRTVAVASACVFAALLGGCTTSIPFNVSESEWNALTPARQKSLRRLAESREPVATQGSERENYQLNLDRSTQDTRANPTAPPAVAP